MNNQKIIKRQEIGTLSTETLVGLTEKSKCSVLAEKFLTLSFNKNNTILTQLQEREKSHRLFWLAFSFVPLAVLVPFFIEDTFWLDFVRKEAYCRVFVGIALGMLACTHLMFTLPFWKAFCIVPISLYLIWSVPDKPFFFPAFGHLTKTPGFFLARPRAWYRACCSLFGSSVAKSKRS